MSASYICLWFAVILARCSVISLTLRLLVCVCVCLLTPERVPLLLTPSVICWWDCCGQLTVYTQKSVSRSNSARIFRRGSRSLRSQFGENRVTTDASDYAMGAGLSQVWDDGEHLVAFESRKMNPA